VVGGAAVLDLRLLGIGATYRSVRQVATQMIPITIFAFAVNAATGVLMFWSDPLRLYRSILFWVKLAGDFAFAPAQAGAFPDSDRVAAAECGWIAEAGPVHD
jgi:hypothetical protein